MTHPTVEHRERFVIHVETTDGNSGFVRCNKAPWYLANDITRATTWEYTKIGDNDPIAGLTQVKKQWPTSKIQIIQLEILYKNKQQLTVEDAIKICTRIQIETDILALQAKLKDLEPLRNDITH